MLTDIRKNLTIFDSMMETIQGVSPKQPLHPELPPFLDRVMKEHTSALDYELLEETGHKPKNAYYVVKGFVLLMAYDEQGDPYVYRIYRANSIVALDSFLDREEADCNIYLGKDSVVWSISFTNIEKIYAMADGMKDFVAKAARKYDQSKEMVRRRLLALRSERRVLVFYTLFRGLLPARKSPLRDRDIASYLLLNARGLLEIRNRLIDNGKLKNEEKYLMDTA